MIVLLDMVHIQKLQIELKKILLYMVHTSHRPLRIVHLDMGNTLGILRWKRNLRNKEYTSLLLQNIVPQDMGNKHLLHSN